MINVLAEIGMNGLQMYLIAKETYDSNFAASLAKEIGFTLHVNHLLGQMIHMKCEALFFSLYLRMCFLMHS